MKVRHGRTARLHLRRQLIDRKMAANTAVQSLPADIISVVAPGHDQTGFIPSGLSLLNRFSYCISANCERLMWTVPNWGAGGVQPKRAAPYLWHTNDSVKEQGENFRMRGHCTANWPFVPSSVGELCRNSPIFCSVPSFLLRMLLLESWRLVKVEIW